MNPKVLIGLSKLLEQRARNARSDVTPGEYELDATVTLHVEGTLRVTEDQEYTPTSSLPWKLVLAHFVRNCGVTRERALQILEDVMHAALQSHGEADAAELLATLTDLEEAEARVQATLDALPKKTRKGAVSVTELNYREVSSSSSATRLKRGA